MAWSGINKKKLASFGGEAHCFMSDEDVAKRGKRAWMYKSCNLYGKRSRSCRKRNVIFAIGNAPTALIRLYELIKEGKLNPALIIGAPVGL